MNAWTNEHNAWEAFGTHCRGCTACGAQRPELVSMCAEGEALHHAWELALAVAERAEEEADEASDCADDIRTVGLGDEDRPWSPEL